VKLLVTGGAGFIGSRYVRGLCADEYAGYENADVTVLDKFTYAGNPNNLPASERLTVVPGDVCDANLLADLLPGHDAVVHFAAESHVDRSVDDGSAFARTNVVGTQTLMEACVRAGVPRVVHISTDEVYGSIVEGSWTEDWPLAPNSPYAASKAGSDLIARAYARTHGLNVSITRCSNNYGPYQYPEKVIPLFITNLMNGEPVPLYGDGSNIREWLHVDDHCRAIHAVLTGGGAGEIYNIGGGVEMSNLELTELLLKLCGADFSQVRRVADRKGHDLRYSLCDDKIREQLGYAPQVDFAVGLEEVVRWYADNAWWWKPLLATSGQE
jgi:dTDP-glucose 4,6-dehydratase